jgi:hypothetical protein
MFLSMYYPSLALEIQTFFVQAKPVSSPLKIFTNTEARRLLLGVIFENNLPASVFGNIFSESMPEASNVFNSMVSNQTVTATVIIHVPSHKVTNQPKEQHKHKLTTPGITKTEHTHTHTPHAHTYTHTHHTHTYTHTTRTHTYTHTTNTHTQHRHTQHKTHTAPHKTWKSTYYSQSNHTILYYITEIFTTNKEIQCHIGKNQ